MTLDVLHVPFTYFPDASGGTEIYVSGLAASLQEFGFRCAVAAPADEEANYIHDGTRVFRFASGARAALEEAYGEANTEAAKSFLGLVARERPRIVHLHSRSAAVSEALIDAAHEAGSKVIFTFHTPTVSCLRGTMMLMGRSPCDGALRVQRCTACTLAANGIAPGLRDVLAAVPEGAGATMGRLGLAGGPFTALRMTSLVGTAHRRFRAFMERCDRVVAVCEWVANVLRVNGLPETKLSVCRQGVTRQAIGTAAPACRSQGSPLKLSYFGRLHPTKGIDIVVGALGLIPDARVQLNVYGVMQPGGESYVERLRQAAARDARITLCPALDPNEVERAMQSCDAVVIPSRWLETGPLVVFEAFAAGVPVLGARLGGIAELVKEGTDGLLVEPDDTRAWSKAIEKLASDPELVADLKAGVASPRTMHDAGREMAALYRSVLSEAHG